MIKFIIYIINDSYCLFMLFTFIIFLFSIQIPKISNFIKVQKIISEIKKLSSNKQSFFENYKIIGNIIERKFKNNIFKSYWGKYSQNNMKDYLPNIELVFDSKEIIENGLSKRLSSYIPSFCTSLGILGTFIGLYNGIGEISGDEFSNESIMGLLIGLRFAFITSILGIILSIVWSFLDKLIVSKFYSTLHSFYIEFNNKFNTYNQELMPHMFLQNQNEQVELLKSIASDLIHKLAEQISNSLNSTLMPEFSKLFEFNTSIVDSIKNSQFEGMGNIVNNFINEMNNSLNGQFEELGNTIKSIIEWQMESKESMNLIISELETAGKNQLEINKNTYSLLAELESYVKMMMEIQNNLNEFNNLSKEFIVEINKHAENTFNSVEIVGRTSDNLSTQILKLEEINDKVINNYSELVDYFRSINESLENSTETFVGSLENGLKGTFNKFDQGLADITGHLSGTIKKLHDSLIELPAIVDDINNAISNFHIDIEKTNKLIVENIKTLR